MDRSLTVAVLAILVVALIAGIIGVVGLLADGPSLSEEWSADAESSFDRNHHRAAVARVDGMMTVGVPVNGPHGTQQCRVVTYEDRGSVEWSAQVPPEHCHAHAVGDLTGATLDGEPTYLVGTGEEELLAFDARTGDVRFAYDLDEFGYSPPAVVDLTGDGTEEVVAVDFFGGVYAMDATGEHQWEHAVEGSVWTGPIAIDHQGEPAVVVAHGEIGEFGGVTSFDGNGEVLWSVDVDRPILSMTATQVDGEDVLVTGSRGGNVSVRAPDGTERWGVERDARTAVATDAERVYVTADDGSVTASDLDGGELEWQINVTDHPEGTPHPLTAELDGETKLVVGTVDGELIVLDPESGERLTDLQIDASLYATPTPADVTGDGTEELIVVDGTARTTVFSYEDG